MYYILDIVPFFFLERTKILFFFLNFLTNALHIPSQPDDPNDDGLFFLFLFLSFSSLNIFLDLQQKHRRAASRERQRRPVIIMCLVVLHRDGIPDVRTRFTTATSQTSVPDTLDNSNWSYNP